MARGKNAYLDHLAQVSLFAALSNKELQKIAKASDEVEVAAGKTLVEEGAIGHEFFLILEGEAVVKRAGRKLTLGPGQYFGELALLDRKPRSASVVAETDMKLLVIGQREFSGVIDEVPGLSHKLLAAMAARLRDADTKVDAVSH
jgi:CRP/FNR family transcriptional regulator, cyclic AMP receptor protein